MSEGEPLKLSEITNLALALEPHEQHKLAERLAANVGYVLREEGGHDEPPKPLGDPLKLSEEQFQALEMYVGALIARAVNGGDFGSSTYADQRRAEAHRLLVGDGDGE